MFLHDARGSVVGLVTSAREYTQTWNGADARQHIGPCSGLGVHIGASRDKGGSISRVVIRLTLNERSVAHSQPRGTEVNARVLC